MSERPTVLIVDDERTARETIEALLASERYQLEFATTGRGALERLSGPPIDLMICDIIMPGMDGFEVCRTIKAHPQWRFVPLILVTALDAEDDMVRGLEAGADEFLTKPIGRVVLRARVRAMLRVREQYKQLRAGAPDVDALLRARRQLTVEVAGLSAREREVLDLLLLGRMHEDIAAVLGISVRTSKFHQQNILTKLGAESRADLARIFL